MMDDKYFCELRAEAIEAALRDFLAWFDLEARGRAKHAEAEAIAKGIPGAEIVEHADGNLDVLISDDEGTRARLMRQPNGLWHACMWSLTPEQCCELGKLLVASDRGI
jgi:hypothetical protein